MRKINTIWYGTRILAICGLLLIVIPMISYVFFITFLRTDIMITIIKVSVIAGAATLLILGVILAIELQQDRRINLKYKQVRYRKIQINNEMYECQNCGSRKVDSEDAYCRQCGTRFVKE